jgi:hypothetical protein
MKIAHREGTDYAFLSSLPISFAGEDVQFEGCAGSVRVMKDEIVLALTGGTGRVVTRAQSSKALLRSKNASQSPHSSPRLRSALHPLTKVTMPAWDGGEQIAPGLFKKPKATSCATGSLPRSH